MNALTGDPLARCRRERAVLSSSWFEVTCAGTRSVSMVSGVVFALLLCALNPSNRRIVGAGVPVPCNFSIQLPRSDLPLSVFLRGP